jgi:aminoglycoside phosphotransferase (APT) family kinase protein
MKDQAIDLLQAYYQDKFPAKQNLKIRNLADITSGWESELYTFEMEYGLPSERVCEDLVLRIYSGEGAARKAAHEFHAIQKLHESGYPVPGVYLLENEGFPLDGRPFIIMERIHGEELWSKMARAAEEQLSELVSLFCKLFVRLHKLDWRAFVKSTNQAQLEDPYAYVDGLLRIIRNGVEQFPQSGFQPVVEWFQERRERLRCARPSITHNDFHPRNVLVQEDGRPVVIDWTGFRISDARFDLGWTLVLTYAYMGSAWRDRILQGYQQHAGAEIEALDDFEAFACARRLVDISISLLLGAEKRGMRSDAVAVIRNDRAAHERVYQLFVDRTGLYIPAIETLLS